VPLKPPRRRRGVPRAQAPAPLSLRRVRTYPLGKRPSKVGRGDLGRPHVYGASVASFLDSLPQILGAASLRALAADVLAAHARSRPIIWGIGAHVIKTGLSPVLLDLMDRGFLTGLAMNGAGIVHDFELAVAGKTSEDVAETLGEGSFGMARETGEILNRAIKRGARSALGLGEAVGRELLRINPRHIDLSLVAGAVRRGLPVTVHVAIGTDIIHMHPACDGAAVGKASHLDFRIFAAQVARMGDGGAYLNVGSAVLLPEVFLKALTVARNLGHDVTGITTANLDFIQSYRPNTNVVRRPTRDSGRGYSLTGHHEILIPLLAAALIEGSGL
jgi:hypothetical protein